MIRLRPIDPVRDAPALHAIFGDEASCRFLPDPATATVEETQAKLSKWSAAARETDWAITKGGGDGTAIGRVTIWKKEGGVWELGIMTVPSLQTRGIASAALRTAIDIVDGTHAPRRIEADIDPDNTPSIRLHQRLGFQFEGTLRKRWSTHLGERDTALYALIDTDPRPWRGTDDRADVVGERPLRPNT